MNKFVLTADSFEGNLTFFFDSLGYMCEFQNNSWSMSTEVKRGVLGQFENWRTFPEFEAWAKKFKYRWWKEPIDVGFERFWSMYNSPRDRHVCEPIWNKLSNDRRYAILLNLKAYNRYCARNPKYIKMSAKTYLRAKHYIDDWDKVKDFF